MYTQKFTKANSLEWDTLHNRFSYWFILGLVLDAFISLVFLVILASLKPLILDEINQFPLTSMVPPYIILIGAALGITHIVLIPNLMSPNLSLRLKGLRIIIGIFFALIPPTLNYILFFIVGFVLFHLCLIFAFPICWSLAGILVCYMFLKIQKILPGTTMFPSTKSANIASALAGNIAGLFLLFKATEEIQIAEIPLITMIAGIPVSWIWLREFYKSNRLISKT